MVTAKPREVPPEVARGFARAMRDFFAETDPHKQDAIAAHQLKVMQGYQGPREEPLRLSDIKQMFEQMREQRE